MKPIPSKSVEVEKDTRYKRRSSRFRNSNNSEITATDSIRKSPNTSKFKQIKDGTQGNKDVVCNSNLDCNGSDKWKIIHEHNGGSNCIVNKKLINNRNDSFTTSSPIRKYTQNGIQPEDISKVFKIISMSDNLASNTSSSKFPVKTYKNPRKSRFKNNSFENFSFSDNVFNSTPLFENHEHDAILDADVVDSTETTLEGLEFINNAWYIYDYEKNGVDFDEIRVKTEPQKQIISKSVNGSNVSNRTNMNKSKCILETEPNTKNKNSLTLEDQEVEICKSGTATDLSDSTNIITNKREENKFELSTYIFVKEDEVSLGKSRQLRSAVKERFDKKIVKSNSCTDLTYGRKKEQSFVINQTKQTNRKSLKQLKVLLSPLKRDPKRLNIKSGKSSIKNLNGKIASETVSSKQKSNTHNISLDEVKTSLPVDSRDNLEKNLGIKKLSPNKKIFEEETNIPDKQNFDLGRISKSVAIVKLSDCVTNYKKTRNTIKLDNISTSQMSSDEGCSPNCKNLLNISSPIEENLKNEFLNNVNLIIKPKTIAEVVNDTLCKKNLDENYVLKSPLEKYEKRKLRSNTAVKKSNDTIVNKTKPEESAKCSNEHSDVSTDLSTGEGNDQYNSLKNTSTKTSLSNTSETCSLGDESDINSVSSRITRSKSSLHRKSFLKNHESDALLSPNENNTEKSVETLKVNKNKDNIKNKPVSEESNKHDNSKSKKNITKTDKIVVSQNHDNVHNMLHNKIVNEQTAYTCRDKNLKNKSPRKSLTVHLFKTDSKSRNLKKSIKRKTASPNITSKEKLNCKQNLEIESVAGSEHSISRFNESLSNKDVYSSEYLKPKTVSKHVNRRGRSRQKKIDLQISYTASSNEAPRAIEDTIDINKSMLALNELNKVANRRGRSRNEAFNSGSSILESENISMNKIKTNHDLKINNLSINKNMHSPYFVKEVSNDITRPIISNSNDNSSTTNIENLFNSNEKQVLKQTQKKSKTIEGADSIVEDKRVINRRGRSKNTTIQSKDSMLETDSNNSFTEINETRHINKRQVKSSKATHKKSKIGHSREAGDNSKADEVKKETTQRKLSGNTPLKSKSSMSQLGSYNSVTEKTSMNEIKHKELKIISVSSDNIDKNYTVNIDVHSPNSFKEVSKQEECLIDTNNSVVNITTSEIHPRNENEKKNFSEDTRKITTLAEDIYDTDKRILTVDEVTNRQKRSKKSAVDLVELNSKDSTADSHVNCTINKNAHSPNYVKEVYKQVKSPANINNSDINVTTANIESGQNSITDTQHISEKSQRSSNITPDQTVKGTYDRDKSFLSLDKDKKKFSQCVQSKSYSNSSIEVLESKYNSFTERISMNDLKTNYNNSPNSLKNVDSQVESPAAFNNGNLKNTTTDIKNNLIGINGTQHENGKQNTSQNSSNPTVGKCHKDLRDIGNYYSLDVDITFTKESFGTLIKDQNEKELRKKHEHEVSNSLSSTYLDSTNSLNNSLCDNLSEDSNITITDSNLPEIHSEKRSESDSKGDINVNIVSNPIVNSFTTKHQNTQPSDTEINLPKRVENSLSSTYLDSTNSLNNSLCDNLSEDSNITTTDSNLPEIHSEKRSESDSKGDINVNIVSNPIVNSFTTKHQNTQPSDTEVNLPKRVENSLSSTYLDSTNSLNNSLCDNLSEDSTITTTDSNLPEIHSEKRSENDSKGDINVNNIVSNPIVNSFTTKHQNTQPSDTEVNLPKRAENNDYSSLSKKNSTSVTYKGCRLNRPKLSGNKINTKDTDKNSTSSTLESVKCKKDTESADTTPIENDECYTKRSKELKNSASGSINFSEDSQSTVSADLVEFKRISENQSTLETQRSINILNSTQIELNSNISEEQSVVEDEIINKGNEISSKLQSPSDVKLKKIEQSILEKKELLQIQNVEDTTSDENTAFQDQIQINVVLESNKIENSDSITEVKESQDVKENSSNLSLEPAINFNDLAQASDLSTENSIPEMESNSTSAVDVLNAESPKKGRGRPRKNTSKYKSASNLNSPELEYFGLESPTLTSEIHTEQDIPIKAGKIVKPKNTFKNPFKLISNFDSSEIVSKEQVNIIKLENTTLDKTNNKRGNKAKNLFTNKGISQKKLRGRPRKNPFAISKSLCNINVQSELTDNKSVINSYTDEINTIQIKSEQPLDSQEEDKSLKLESLKNGSIHKRKSKISLSIKRPRGRPKNSDLLTIKRPRGRPRKNQDATSSQITSADKQNKSHTKTITANCKVEKNDEMNSKISEMQNSFIYNQCKEESDISPWFESNIKNEVSDNSFEDIVESFTTSTNKILNQGKFDYDTNIHYNNSFSVLTDDEETRIKDELRSSTDKLFHYKRRRPSLGPSTSFLNKLLFEYNKDHTVQPNVGKLFWAQISKYPYWPCVICYIPGTEIFKKTVLMKGHVLKQVYHVRFFGDNGRRSWINANRLIEYKSQDDLQLICESYTNFQSKSSTNILVNYVKPSLFEKWTKSLEEIEFVKSQNYNLMQLDNFFNEVIKSAGKGNRKVPKKIKEEPKIKEEISDDDDEEEQVKKKMKLITEDSPTISKEVKQELIDHNQKSSPILEPSGPQIEEEVLIKDEITDNEYKIPLSTFQNFGSFSMEEQKCLFKNNNLFKGVSKDRVCQFCFDFGKILKCKGGCHGTYHLKCATAVLAGKNSRKRSQLNLSKTEDTLTNNKVKISDKAESLFPDQTIMDGRNQTEITENHTGLDEQISETDESRTEIDDNQIEIDENRVQIITVPSSVCNTPPIISFPPDYMNMTLEERIDYKMKEIMEKFESPSYTKLLNETIFEENLRKSPSLCTDNFPISQESNKESDVKSHSSTLTKALTCNSPNDLSPNHFERHCKNEKLTNTHVIAESSPLNEDNKSIIPKRTPVETKLFTVSKKALLKHVTADSDSIEINDSESMKSSSSRQSKQSDVADNVEPSKNSPVGIFKCGFCTENIDPYCFICQRSVSPNGSKVRQRCCVFRCSRFYHPQCLKLWPQTQWSLIQTTKNRFSQEVIDSFSCPQHVCHTCVSEDPRAASSRCSGDKIAKCLLCPASYHPTNLCIPAGTQIVTSTQIICPRHRNKRGTVTINTHWCFLCNLGGNLICCETCPTSVHAECTTLSLTDDDKFICEDCESGRLPLYDEIVWVKLGNHKWWPGLILFPNEIPLKVLHTKHSKGEFVVKFFGTYDHYWVNTGRAFLFQEGDTIDTGLKARKKYEAVFQKAVEEAVIAHKLKKQFKAMIISENVNSLKPPPYIKIKYSKPVGNVKLMELDLSNTTACECDPSQPNPCGPDSNCLNRLLWTECNPELCPAGKNCKNQSFEQREYPPLEPYKTETRGWGLKSLAPIKKGQFIIEYVGELIDDEEFQRRVQKMHAKKEENYYFLTIHTNRMIDAGPKGNVARFMNHCCQPNCETQKWTVNGETRVGLFATEDIPAHTELTFNYNLECTGTEKKVCSCGAPNCSGFIGVKAKQEAPEPKKPKRVFKKKKPEKTEKVIALPPCYVCQKTGDVAVCNNKICTKAFHLECIDLQKWPEGKKFVCPWHYCNWCAKRTIRCCVKCLNSFCPPHSEGNIRYHNLIGFICRVHDQPNSNKAVSPTKKKRTNTLVGDTVVSSTTTDDDGDEEVSAILSEEVKKTKRSTRVEIETGNGSDSFASSVKDSELDSQDETVSSATISDLDDSPRTGKKRKQKTKKKLIKKRKTLFTAHSNSLRV